MNFRKAIEFIAAALLAGAHSASGADVTSAKQWAKRWSSWRSSDPGAMRRESLRGEPE